MLSLQRLKLTNGQLCLTTMLMRGALTAMTLMKNAIEFTVPVTQTKDLQESLEFSFETLSNEKLNLVIRWEYTKVEIPIEIDKKETIEKIVEQLKEVKQYERDLEGKDTK